MTRLLFRNITKYMTQSEIEQQLVMLSQVPINNVNYYEFLEMFHVWNKPMNKFNIWWDLENENLILILGRLKELRYYYE